MKYKLITRDWRFSITNFVELEEILLICQNVSYQKNFDRVILRDDGTLYRYNYNVPCGSTKEMVEINKEVFVKDNTSPIIILDDETPQYNQVIVSARIQR